MDMATAKVSIAIRPEELRLARRAAADSGVSLSAFFSRAVRTQLEEHRREQAARELLATFDDSELPTLARQRELLALWNQPRGNKRTRTARTKHGRSRR
jgi:hypothetical protein